MTDHRTVETGVSQVAVEQRAGAPARPGGKWWTLVAVCLGIFMLLLDITIVTVALPDIQRGLGSSFSGLQWIVDAYALTLAAFLLTAGSLSDMYGRRLLFLVGLVVFTGASLLCGFATSTLMLQVSRAVQGVGGATMFAVSLALLADAFRGKDRGVAFGIWGAITGIAVAVGPLLGGVLTSGISWRWIFFVNGPIGAVAIVLTVLKVAESRQSGAARPDWPGFVLFSLGLACLVYGLIESNQKSFGNSLVVGSFVAAGVLLAAFVLAELRGRHPMFDLALFRVPAFSGGCVAAFGLSASIFAMILYLVLYVQDILGYSALGTGLRMTVMSAGMFAAATISGRASTRVPVRLLIGAGLIGGGAGLLLMRGLGAASSWTHLIPGLILAGVGAGLVNPPLASTAVGVVRPERAGMASGINSTFRQVGIATGIAVLGTLFSHTLTEHVRATITTVPHISGRAAQITAAVQAGQTGRLIAHLPARTGHAVAIVTRSAFTAGLNQILLIAAIIALASGLVSFAAIRGQDFVAQSPTPLSG
jgi:EmrB/QacA subfamily drug resistance transporter